MESWHVSKNEKAERQNTLTNFKVELLKSPITARLSLQPLGFRAPAILSPATAGRMRLMIVFLSQSAICSSKIAAVNTQYYRVSSQLACSMQNQENRQQLIELLKFAVLYLICVIQ